MEQLKTTAHQRDIYTVTRLNNEVRDELESSFPMLWVEGEISNLARPGSGHFYFSLKDPASQVRCAMFRGQNRLLRFKPENGLHVLARARIGLYAPRGEFQLVIESMQEYGEGALQQAFEALKKRLAEEGLFAAARKRPLPTLPGRIGVITSPSGAAIRDIITVLGRRFPAIPVHIYPVAVQGDEAIPGIVDALRTAGERSDCDVLILARGGGSLEDLWAFNDERVARAMVACPLPLVTGIGHEIDYTIADFVADHRAATPSAAAETVTPDQEDWRRRFARMADRLQTLARSRLQLDRQRLGWLGARLQHPRARLMELSQRLDMLATRLASAQSNRRQREVVRLHAATSRLQRHNPAALLQVLKAHNTHLAHRLEGAWRHGQSQHRSRLAALGRALDAVSPLATLDRGYAIITSHPNGELIRSIQATSAGRQIKANLGDGSLLCTVDACLNQETAVDRFVEDLSD